MKHYLGIEFGSTRIKAVAIDADGNPVSSGDYTWQSRFENGVWTYPMEQVLEGLKTAASGLSGDLNICGMGISGMMHGYLPFDKDWNLLTPFRTWQNTMTAEAADELTKLFGFNIPQRWSIAHLYQAVLNGEEHVPEIAHITTLAGYVHYLLTGVNAVGIGEASGIFPLEGDQPVYNKKMLAQMNEKLAEKGVAWRIEDLLPDALVAGEEAGRLTECGAEMLAGKVAVGTPFAPAEGDAETGMVCTGAVTPRTGNISAGTSVFAMIVLEKALKEVHPEIDIVATPTGSPVAMVHANNCTNDINRWVGMLKETMALFGCKVSDGELYTKLYQESLKAEPDADGLAVFNYMAGEGVTHLDEGRPVVLRMPDTVLSIANFMRAQLFGALATIRLGMAILETENVVVDELTGHGGFFKTPVVGQSYMAAACRAAVTCRETAGEGGPYGMALLASYMGEKQEGETLEAYLKKLFTGCASTTISADETLQKGFDDYMKRYEAALEVEKSAVKCFRA